MANEGKDQQPHTRGTAPERLEPDLTPAPGTPRAGSAGGSERDELGFDPESPDLADPQVDPTHPAKPEGTTVGNSQKRAKGDAYPPYKGS